MSLTVYRRRYDFRALRGWIMPELILNISPTDSISVTESIVIHTGIILLSVSDTVTITELTPVFVSGLAVRITEPVTVAEAIVALLPVLVPVTM